MVLIAYVLNPAMYSGDSHFNILGVQTCSWNLYSPQCYFKIACKAISKPMYIMNAWALCTNMKISYCSPVELLSLCMYVTACGCDRFTICHKTEVVKNTLNPVWQAFKIPVRALCNGDYDR